MSRLIFVPMLPVKMRYSEWWVTEFPKQFSKYFDVTIIGKKFLESKNFNNDDNKLFSPIDESIQFELYQIHEYLQLELKLDDILFTCDLSFPGFFANVLHHRRPRKCYAFCHATSLNVGDYFENVRRSKWRVECGQSYLFDKVFVGSKYHYNKLTEIGLYPPFDGRTLDIIGLPNPPMQTFKEEKKHNIISVARPSYQKVNQEVEENIEKEFGKIVRKECNTWEEYYKFVSSGRILLITSREDTFNYTILDAINNNTIVLAPNRIVFPEILDERYLYNDISDLKNKIYHYLLSSEYVVPEIKCSSLVDNFFENLIKRMKENE